MVRDFQYTSLQDALGILRRSLRMVPRREWADVRQAYGRVLAADIVARENVPARDSSHFDGFAVRAADVAGAEKGAPVALKLRTGVPLGQVPRMRIGPGEACRVATGGFLPAGADTVVPVEDVVVEGGTILASRAVRPGDYVYPAGQDIKKGERILESGRTLEGQDLVLLASLHMERVPVVARPRVAILPTGSELTDRIRGAEVGKVVESHSIIIGRLVEEAGGLPVRLGIAPDEKAALVRQLKAALRGADVVLTMAGSSVGEPDLVDSAINAVGRPGVLVHGVRLHRGRVMGFGVVSNTPVVILPGPIQGALNAFIAFGYPLIRAQLGRGLEEPPSIPATVAEDWSAAGKFREFAQVLYVEVRRTEGDLLALPATAETEKVSFLVSKNGYTVVPEGKVTLKKGERVWVHLLPGFSRLP